MLVVSSRVGPVLRRPRTKRAERQGCTRASIYGRAPACALPPHPPPPPRPAAPASPRTVLAPYRYNPTGRLALATFTLNLPLLRTFSSRVVALRKERDIIHV